MTRQNTEIATADQRSISELYPIADDGEVTKHIFRRSRKERDEDGTMIIHAPLTSVERQMISGRLKQIVPHLEPAKPGQIRKAVAEMLVGFGAIRAAGDVEAAAVIAKFEEALQGLPLWAIRRACLRFARGEVHKDEVASRAEIDVGKPPTTGQLRMVAEATCRPHRDEATIANMLLRAKVSEERELSPEEVERRREIAEKAREEFARRVREQSGETEGERAERERREHGMIVRQREALIAEYEDHGIEPVYADDACQIVVSLSMMLATGWRIEHVDGRKVLTR